MTGCVYLKLASSMHLLVGKAYEAVGNYDLAAEEFKQALNLDVYCHEAFEKLIGHHFLTASEGACTTSHCLLLLRRGQLLHLFPTLLCRCCHTVGVQ